MITVKELEYWYESHRSLRSNAVPSHKLFSGISFNVECRDVVCVTGLNGSGKTTLLRLIAKILSPSRGEVLHRQGIRISTFINFFDGGLPHISVIDYIYLKALYAGKPYFATMSHLRSVLNVAELDIDYKCRLEALSSGQQMRLNFGYVLCDDADVIIMDEWLAVGDAVYRAKVKPLIDEFIRSENRALIFATHDQVLKNEISTFSIDL